MSAIVPGPQVPFLDQLGSRRMMTTYSPGRKSFQLNIRRGPEKAARHGTFTEGKLGGSFKCLKRRSRDWLTPFLNEVTRLLDKHGLWAAPDLRAQ